MPPIPPLYKPQNLKLKLLEKRQLTHDVSEFIFAPTSPNVLNFEPGQFININIPSEEKRIVRSYSISSSPTKKDEIELCIKLVDGPGSRYFAGLSAGDEVTGSGPFGIFTVKDTYTEDMLFVATGTGVAPIKSMVGYRLERNFQGKMTIFFGLRREEDIFYDELFNGIASAHANINYVLTLSRPSDAWHGKKGRVTDLIKTSPFILNTLRVFICGNGDMIKEVADIFKEMGLPEEKIHHEKFY